MESESTNVRKRSTGLPSWLTFGGVLAVVTLILTILGYGWTTGYLHAFGLKPTDLGKTPLDFLLASEEVIVRMLTAISQAWSDPPWHALLEFWAGTSVFGLSVLVVVFFGLLAVVHWARLLVWLSRWVWPFIVKTRVPAGAARIRKELGKGSRRVYWGGAGLVAAGYVAVVPILAIGVLILLSVFTLAVTALPLRPAVVADRFAKAAVIEPARCASLRGEKHAHSGARCVRLVKDDCEVRRGRLIAANASRMWLLLKPTHQVVSIPLDGVAVEDISDEKPVPPSPACTP